MQALKIAIINSLILADGPETRGPTPAVLAALLGQHPADCATSVGSFVRPPYLSPQTLEAFRDTPTLPPFLSMHPRLGTTFFDEHHDLRLSFRLVPTFPRAFKHSSSPSAHGNFESAKNNLAAICRFESVEQFEKAHAATIRDHDFKPGATRSLLKLEYAVFRLVPYYARSRTSIPVMQLIEREDLIKIHLDEDMVEEDPEGEEEGSAEDVQETEGRVLRSGCAPSHSAEIAHLLWSKRKFFLDNVGAGVAQTACSLRNAPVL
ncbi:hypothetical protein EDB86DRAFT_3187129 [Lactarius hatsudake]|nr:hypothetical protein EDB86DRAFT_3187129 [Lactarius hatsudake]